MSAAYDHPLTRRPLPSETVQAPSPPSPPSQVQSDQQQSEPEDSPIGHEIFNQQENLRHQENLPRQENGQQTHQQSQEQPPPSQRQYCSSNLIMIIVLIAALSFQAFINLPKSPVPVQVELNKEQLQWLIQQMRSKGVQSVAEIEEKKKALGPIEFEQFQEKTLAEKFEIPFNKSETFLRRYLSRKNVSQNDTETLIDMLMASKGNMENKFFNFVSNGTGEFSIYYITLKVHQDMVYFSLIASQFQFTLSPTSRGWFTWTNQYKLLTDSEKQNLQAFFVYESLKSLHGSLQVDIKTLDANDRQFLEYSSSLDDESDVL